MSKASLQPQFNFGYGSCEPYLFSSPEVCFFR